MPMLFPQVVLSTHKTVTTTSSQDSNCSVQDDLLAIAGPSQGRKLRTSKDLEGLPPTDPRDDQSFVEGEPVAEESMDDESILGDSKDDNKEMSEGESDL
jgi:hypothetical protein